MGWTYNITKPRNVKEILDADFTLTGGSSNTRVLASAIVNVKEYYAAIEVTTHFSGDRTVFALVCALDFTDGGFGYKDMDETMGPYFYNCPDKVFRLLTPTTDDTAQKWRSQVLLQSVQKMAARMLKDGDVIKFDTPLTFNKGFGSRDTFTVKRVKSAIHLYNNGQRFNISKWKTRPFTTIQRG